MARKDHIIKKGLALEGGGMRSAYLAGCLACLQDLGITDFDAVAAVSAGACCAVNFLAGEAHKTLAVLRDHLSSRRFINFGHLFTKKNIMDIDYLIDEVFETLSPLNYRKVQNHQTRLFIAATHYHSGKAVYFNNREHDLKSALRASCALPFFYRNQAICHGERYIDGAVSDSIPVKRLIQAGCNEIWVLRTRPENFRLSPYSFPFLNRILYKDNANLARLVSSRHKNYNDAIHLINNPPVGVTIHQFCPQKNLPISRTTTDPARISRAFALAYQEMNDMLQAKALLVL